MSTTEWLVTVVFLTCVGVLPTAAAAGVSAYEGESSGANISMSIKFVVSINDTFDDCLATVVTPYLRSGQNYNNTKPLHVGTCDHGPLVFYVTKGSQDGVSKMDVVVTFYTSNFDAMPPQCSIPWNGTYLAPMQRNPRQSPLPGCWVSDSQEGYNTTDFWFWILQWIPA